jgi:hypothetical protein
MTRTTIAIAISGLVLPLGGCAGMPNGGQNLNGFPIDERCADFWVRSPIFDGNRGLAYATDCVGSNT